MAHYSQRQQTSDHSETVDNANSPEFVNHLQRNSKQQLKYQVWKDMPIPRTAHSVIYIHITNASIIMLGEYPEL